MLRWIQASLVLAVCIAVPSAALAEEAGDVQRDTALVQHPEIVVSATRTKKNQLDVPNGTAVITRDEMRKRNIHTLAEALQDIAGLDTGEGSDNGSGVPNVGMWGLKEFDALLFTVNGVPAGGPFNPSLTQIQVDDLDRIEIVKGPQGTMYGVSAFAGMIQAFTPETESGTGSFLANGGSFGSGNATLSWGRALKEGRTLRLNGTYSSSDGWQDRTGSSVGRGSATIGWGLGKGHLALDLFGYSHQQDWGSPLPYDNGAPVPGFVIDRNYAVIGAEVKHDVFGATSRFTWPMGERRRIENTLSYIHDKQKYLRSFPGEVTGDNLESEGLELHPTETSLYEDARYIMDFDAHGSHELVTGAALTWGETKGDVREFDFDQSLSAYPNMPDLAGVTTLDNRDFEDGRTFFGAYAHDSWTPTPRLTLGAGGRFDAVKEELETEADLPGGPQQVKDEREDTDFLGSPGTELEFAL